MTVYFARIGKDGPIKIGFTSGAPEDRIADLQVGCPWPITNLGSVDGDPAREVFLHEKLDAHRMLGEWFEPHEAVIETVTAALSGSLSWDTPQVDGFDKVFAAFGGPARLAREIGIPPFHAQTMKTRGSIPAAYFLRVAAAADRLSLENISIEALCAMAERRPEAPR
jgi:hypothetical protein